MRAIAIGLAAVALAAAPAAGQAQDLRELVTMPPQVQESLLMNMQDHLVALDTIISHVASERFTEAARVADQRLRFSNPEGEAAITDWFPPEMLGAKDALRAAAARFANAAKKADKARDYASMREVAWAISDITVACTGCHGHYRIR
jgi:cytochrome c556